MIALAQQNRILVLRTVVTKPALIADVDQISEKTGGKVNFSLDATKTNANRKYFLLGSVTGHSPGTKLPGGMILPVNWDIFTDLVITFMNTPLFVNFAGKMDVSGQALATFDTLGPVPGAAGIMLTFAYTLKPYDFVSNYVEVSIVP